MKRYVYNPGYMDMIDPRVLRGNAIKPGAKVIITKQHFSPGNKLIWIMDQDGNEQSVWRNAVVR